MAKSKDKQPKNERDREKKKGFWSSFFEPVPSDEEADPALANRQYGEPPEPPLTHLFNDDEVEFSDEEDADDLAKLSWEDGEKVVTDTERIRYTTKKRETEKVKTKNKSTGYQVFKLSGLAVSWRCRIKEF